MMEKCYPVEILYQKKPLVILAGPTAVGKTAASIGLAKEIGGEIISADSMQVYRGMDIGSAKIMPEEMGGISHHLINILNPDENFNVLLFQKLAKEAVQEIYSHGKIPIVAGGTGFYIQALLYDIDFSEEISNPWREKLEKEAETFGNAALHDKLRAVDPLSADQIHENNRKRVIRALEFFYVNGYPLSEHNERERQKSSPYLFRYDVLTQDREVLYQRIEHRVDQMISQGLVQEVTRLKEEGCTRNMVSMQGLGYKEILDYLDGKCSLEDAILTIKEETRHFAKRQLTWFRRERDVNWINKDDYRGDETLILKALTEDFQEQIGSKLTD